MPFETCVYRHPEVSGIIRINAERCLFFKLVDYRSGGRYYFTAPPDEIRRTDIFVAGSKQLTALGERGGGNVFDTNSNKKDVSIIS